MRFRLQSGPNLWKSAVQKLVLMGWRRAAAVRWGRPKHASIRERTPLISHWPSNSSLAKSSNHCRPSRSALKSRSSLYIWALSQGGTFQASSAGAAVAETSKVTSSSVVPSIKVYVNRIKYKTEIKNFNKIKNQR